MIGVNYTNHLLFPFSFLDLTTKHDISAWPVGVQIRAQTVDMVCIQLQTADGCFITPFKSMHYSRP